MRRRVFIALPAFAVAAPAAAFRTEEASWEFVADLEDTCAAQDAAHERIRDMLARVERGEKLAPEEFRRLATCPFCRCQVAFAPPSGSAR